MDLPETRYAVRSDGVNIARLNALAGSEPRPSVEPAGEQMTFADRAAVRLARRAPGLLRAVGLRSMRDSA